LTISGSGALGSVVSRRDARRLRKVTSRREWESHYIDGLRITDTLVVLLAVTVAQIIRFGEIDFRNPWSIAGYIGGSGALAVLWPTFLAIFRTRSPRVIGNGSEEYRRIVSATFRLFGTVAILSLLFRFDIARLYLAIAFPVGLIGLLLSRWGWRKVVARKRARGEYQTAVLIVGSKSSALSMARSFERSPGAGYSVVGICLPNYEPSSAASFTIDGIDIPVLGDEHSVVEAIEVSGADTVAVTATEHIGHHGLRKRVWDLDGPRLVMRPVSDFPLIHVEKPQYNGAKKFGKTAFDLVFAASVLLLISPILLTLAVIIKFTSRGSIFYKSERMGMDGKPFQMIKFRSMVQDADKRVSDLAALNEGAGVLFKMRDDPRVTPVGKVMRKYSLDELPQFVNVLTREMSVVGPRPPLRSEVETYDGEVRRRLLVKPGITGLWQVSGRSDLSWEESVRLDLSYVENWSMTGDLLIIAKTAVAVAKSEGAY
jgi:exopolysaccharide biosynthesis polyprenyl glycosylphosphotransferase